MPDPNHTRSKPIPNRMRLIVKPRPTKRKFSDDQPEQRTLEDHSSRSYPGPPNGWPPLISATLDVAESRIELPEETEKKLLKILNKHKDVFGKPHPEGIKCKPMTITFYNENTTCKKAPRNLNPTKLRIANEIFDDLIEDGFAEETSTDSKFSSPIVLVIYPDGKKPRLTRDYSGTGGVNASTRPIEAHLPKISDVSIFLSNANFICTLDLPKAFCQVPLDQADYRKTTLSIAGRSIFFKRAAVGLKNVLAFFQNSDARHLLHA
ncbi:hypothetical protein GEMRC1_009287 [Eukaryota sp. GEM-RC1]